MFGSIGKRVKSYLVFTSIIYRITVCLLIPAALVAFAIWAGSNIGDMALVLMLMLFVVAEIISDSWLFGGIQGKDPEKIDYLKASGRGMVVMRGALVFDLFRKFLTALGVIGVSYFFIGRVKVGLAGMNWAAVDYISCGGAFQEMGFLLYLLLLSYSVSALGTFLSRYGNTLYGNMLIGYGAMMLVALAGIYGPVLVQYPSDGIFLLDLLGIAVGIGVSVLAVRAAMKKVEGGYYDE